MPIVVLQRCARVPSSWLVLMLCPFTRFPFFFSLMAPLQVGFIPIPFFLCNIMLQPLMCIICITCLTSKKLNANLIFALSRPPCFAKVWWKTRTALQGLGLILRYVFYSVEFPTGLPLALPDLDTRSIIFDCVRGRIAELLSPRCRWDGLLRKRSK